MDVNNENLQTNEDLLTNETMPPTKQKKSKNIFAKIGEAIRALYTNVIHRYPITMGIIVFTTIFAVVMYDILFSYDAQKNSMEMKLYLFLVLFAVGTLLTEQCFHKKKTGCIIGCVLSASFAGMITWISTSEASWIMGVKGDVARELCDRFVVCYGFIILILSVYFMYKESKTAFQVYLRAIVCAIIRTLIIYWILSIGFIIVVEIFDTLITDTCDWDVIERIQVSITGIFLVPGIIMALSKVKEEISKFEKIVIDYVLVVLTIVAFLIVYAYIVKIVVLHELPANEVFRIITALFCGGGIIWTIAMADTKGLMGKIAKWLPYFFMPCIMLQGICIGMRIEEYGITFLRYLGCQLIVFEIIYCILYIIKKNKWMAYCTFVLIAQLLITVLIPGINAYACIVRSQAKVMEQYDLSSIDTYSRTEVQSFTSAYYAIERDGSVEGMSYLEKHYTDMECRMIEDVDPYEYSDGITRVNVDMEYPEEFSVEGYSTWYAGYIELDTQNGDKEHTLITLNTDGGEVTEDITSFISYYMEHQMLYSDDNTQVATPYVLEDGNCIYFMNFHMQYKENGEVTEFYGEAILLVK